MTKCQSHLSVVGIIDARVMVIGEGSSEEVQSLANKQNTHVFKGRGTNRSFGLEIVSSYPRSQRLKFDCTKKLVSYPKP